MLSLNNIVIMTMNKEHFDFEQYHIIFILQITFQDEIIKSWVFLDIQQLEAVT